ncbi:MULTISPECIES: hypothetical protein [Enterobacter cloacae complex]|uniref:hypothetical protein n=1 Tax=Enterobacter cloacae complex TaxID=354276 RepID=UPI0005EF12BF|nr:hypothetical protein [Enterobacter roggenkampii]EHF8233523.1 hypothetical protein [Enterobacter roggenkampii]EKY3952694.1 hypothetical protein [Enterobacter roggenkampii]EMC7875849.1 hypothetical protein [Enterobacter roggenkampii]KJP74526.1 hypothetical protein SR65_23700 [Enterobacter roggenkampii]KLP37344.1 hypothetical protein ABF66_12245 [Enterobacter roggenkampii]
MYIDNSALTLRNFFISLKDQNTNIIVKNALLVAFELEHTKDNQILLWDKISKLMSLPKKIEDALQDYFPDDEITAPNWRPCVDKFFAQLSLVEPLPNATQRISDAALNDLGMISLLFKTKGQIGKIKDEQLIEIKQQLLELKDSIINSDFSIELKKEILHYVNNMIRAFDDYEITGIEPIISATEATMGHACMSESFNQVVTTTEEGSKLKNILKKTISSINSVEGLVSLGANGVTLLEFLDK